LNDVKFNLLLYLTKMLIDKATVVSGSIIIVM